MPQRRRFAKKSEDVRRFRLVARSQNDGFADDPDAPPLVLEPTIRPGDSRRSGLTEEELLQTPASLADKFPEVFVDPNAPPPASASRTLEHCSEEEEDEEGDEDELDGDCYFPKDGYNYDQHLKRVSGTGKGGGVVGVVIEAKEKVPEKELKMEKPVNNEAEEMMRALECADEYEELEVEEDGGLEELMLGGIADEGVQMLWGPTATEDLQLPDLAAFKAMHAARIAGADALLEGEEFDDFDDEGEGEGDGTSEAGSRRPRRRRAAGAGERPLAATAPPAEAAASAAEFEEFFAAEYEEDADIGALSDEEVEGPLSLARIEDVVDEYMEEQRAEQDFLTSVYEPQRSSTTVPAASMQELIDEFEDGELVLEQRKPERLDDVPRVIGETRAIIERHYAREVEGEDGEETSSGEEETDASRTWDCESVLSTLSNLSNRPGRIGKIKLIKKPEPMKPLKEQDEEDEEEGSEAEGIVELPDVVNERKKDETAEEKRQRKGAVKEMRRICRQMKKESKETYKSEAAKLPCNKAGNGDIRPKSRTFRM